MLELNNDDRRLFMKPRPGSLQRTTDGLTKGQSFPGSSWDVEQMPVRATGKRPWFPMGAFMAEP